MSTDFTLMERVSLDDLLRNACRHVRRHHAQSGLPRVKLQDIVAYARTRRWALRNNTTADLTGSALREYLRTTHALKAVRKDWTARQPHTRTWFLCDDDFARFVGEPFCGTAIPRRGLCACVFCAHERAR